MCHEIRFENILMINVNIAYRQVDIMACLGLAYFKKGDHQKAIRYCTEYGRILNAVRI